MSVHIYMYFSPSIAHSQLSRKNYEINRSVCLREQVCVKERLWFGLRNKEIAVQMFYVCVRLHVYPKRKH